MKYIEGLGWGSVVFALGGMFGVASTAALIPQPVNVWAVLPVGVFLTLFSVGAAILLIGTREPKA